MDSAANQEVQTEEIEITQLIRFYESHEKFLLNDIVKEETVLRKYPLKIPFKHPNIRAQNLVPGPALPT